MNRRFKKMIAIVSAIAMVVCSVTVSNMNTASADDYSTLTYTQVGTTNYYVAANNDEFPFQLLEDQGTQMLIIPQVASGTKPIWPDFSNVTLNGEEFAYGAGAGIYIPYSSLKDNAYNVFQATSAVDSHVFQIIIKAGTPEEGETTTVDPDAPTTTPAPTTTTELQAPSAPAGLVANINDLKTNYTIAFANVAGATSYKFYLDGAYKKDITNGGIVTIEELGLEAGQTYMFGVSAVNAAGESDISTVQVTVPSAEEQTTAEPTSSDETTTPGETIDPSEITEWTPVTGSSNIYYNIYDNEAKVSVKPQIEMIDGKNTVYTALSLAATFSRVVINGVDVEEANMPDGAFLRLFVENLTEEYYTVVVYDHYGTESVTILLKVEEEPETTTAAPVPDDTEILLNTQFIGADNWNHDNMISSTDNGDGSMSCVVEEKAGGETYSTQLVQNGITLEEGKWYVAKYTVSSDVDKNFRLLIQSDGNAGGDWSEFGGLVTSVKAGQEVEVTLKFQASKAANGNALYGILMGYIDATASAEANVTVKAVSLKGYSTEPEVETGSVVVKEPEQEDYKVTVDNEEVSVVDNKVTLGDAAYGYFCDGKMYAPNSEVTVEADMAFTSVKELSVSMANGAGIRYIGTAGIRFQSSIVSDNMDAVASDAITEGTLITASDIYEAKGEELTLTSDYTKLNVTNSGWYNETVGTYCGSICDVVESNYIRNFTARAYVTINYENSDAVTVYSSMGPVRSISQVASAVKAAGYAGIAEEYKSTIDSFIK